MGISAEHRSKFAAHHRQWWRLQMSKKFSSGTKNSKQISVPIFQKLYLFSNDVKIGIY